MLINNVELEDLDVFDLEVAEKFEKALSNVKDISKEVEHMNVVESIRTQCNAVFSVFNDLFGEGTDKKVFGNKVNLMTCLKALDELVTKLNSNKNEVEKLYNKYSPNRVK